MTGPESRRAGKQATTFFALDSNEYGRGVSFFDAIYGFAATLLIANLDAPPAEAWKSVQALLDSGFGTQIFGFVLSFVVIVAFWRANVRLMRDLTGMDGPTLTANLVAAGFVIIIPFTTQGISDPDSADYALPTALYALNIALAALAQSAVSMIGRLRGLERHDVPQVARIYDVIAALLTPVIFGCSIPIALAFGPGAGQWTWLTLAFALPILGRLSQRSRDQAKAAPPSTA